MRQRPFRLSAAALVCGLSGLMLLSAPARARDLPAVAAPFEVGDSLAGNYLAALVAGASRDTFAAATYFREALRADPGNGELRDRTFVASLANGDMEEAFRLAESLTRRPSGGAGLAQLALATRDIGRERFASARKHLLRAGPMRARDVTSTLLFAWTQAGSKDAKGALATLERLNDPAFAVFRDFHAALILDVLGKRADALKRMKSAYDGEKSTLRLVDAYGRMLSQAGRREDALAVYEGIAKSLPRHPVVLDAIAQLKDGKTLAPLIGDAKAGAGEALYGLGAAGSRQGDELASMIYLRLGLFLAPGNAMALLSLADAYERTKQFERAIDVYQLVAKDSPLRASAEVQAALDLEQLGKPEEAAAQLSARVAESPSDIDALMALGNLDITRKAYGDAIAAFDKAVAQVKPEPAYWSLFYRRGVAFERDKQWPKAEADFKQALKLYPEQPLVLNYLGYSWVDRGMNLDEAFKMLRRAVELRPSDGYIVDSLGWAYYKLGRYDDAVAELERAVELKPADPVVNDHLGDAYWKVGRKLEAGFQWNQARDLKPDLEDLTRIQRKIEHGLDEEAAAPPAIPVPAVPVPTIPAPPPIPVPAVPAPAIPTPPIAVPTPSTPPAGAPAPSTPDQKPGG